MSGLRENKKLFYLFSAFLATSTGMLIFFLFPPIHPYKCNLISKEISSVEIQSFNDLDNDGVSEQIRFFENFNGISAYIVEKSDKMLYQRNLMTKFSNHNYFYYGDYNNDQNNEIYTISYKEDSVFLDVVKGISGEILIENSFISKFFYHAGKPDFQVINMELIDTNKDGLSELIITLHCGFSYKTRLTCLYDLEKKNVVKRTPIAAEGIHKTLQLLDITSDGKPEIFGESGAFGNSPEFYPLSDQYIWFFILSSELNFIFPPKVVGHYPGLITTRPLFFNNNGRVAVFYSHMGNRKDSTVLAVYSLAGDLMHKKVFPFSIDFRSSVLHTVPEEHPEKIILLRSNGLLQEFDQNLFLIKEKKFVPFSGCLTKTNVDGDIEKEYLLTDNMRNLIIADNNLQSATIVPEIMDEEYYISVETTADNKRFLNIQSGELLYKFNYHINPFYKLRYLIWFFLWVFLLLVFLFIGKIYQQIISKKFESERKLATLQITAIENQLTPHFNLNVLNAIGALYESQEKIKAQYYLGKYTRLLRNLLMLSGQISVTIGEELEFTTHYLELERLRFDGKFNVEIINETPFLTLEIPKMLLHTFCENAVKHGLKHLKENGLLKIEFEQTKNDLKITISDNGIGREKARQYSLMSTGKGLEILNQNLKLYKQLKNVLIAYKITDIYNYKNEPDGTKVEITIPKASPNPTQRGEKKKQKK
jgi:hypothetical protein